MREMYREDLIAYKKLEDAPAVTANAEFAESSGLEEYQKMAEEILSQK